MQKILLSLAAVALAATLCHAQDAPKPPAPPMTLTQLDPAKQNEWLTAWDKEITGESKGFRTCDKAVGEDIAWTVAPMLNGFYYGYMATGNTKYVDMLVDWTDSLLKRAVKEPDGYLGWPSKAAAGTAVDNLDDYNADSFLSDAMAFTPIELMAGEMTKNPALKDKYAAKGDVYLKFADQIYEKWVKRGGWRDTKDGGMISVTLPYGMNADNTQWIDFETRNDPGHGFSHPDNKANLVARWMLAMWDVTGKPEYKDRAEKWFKLMKSRMTLNDDGTYKIWNYWQPAGPWDYKPNGDTKHWVGVHPNAGYYQSDVSDIVNAYDHGVVFTKTDIQHLIDTAKTSWANGDPGSPVPGMLVSISFATGMAKQINGCFPNSKTAQPLAADASALTGKVVSATWDAKAGKGQITVERENARPGTILTDKNTKVQVLRMWTALAPYDPDIQKHFEATNSPTSWGGLTATPHYLMLQAKLAK